MMGIGRHILGYLTAVSATIVLLPVLSDVPALLGISNRVQHYHVYLFYVIPFVLAYTLVPFVVATRFLTWTRSQNQWAFALAGAGVGISAYVGVLLTFELSEPLYRSVQLLARVAVVGAIAGLLYHVVIRKTLGRAE